MPSCVGLVNPQHAGFMLSPATFSWPWCLPEPSSSGSSSLIENKPVIPCSPPPCSVCLQGQFSTVWYQLLSEVLLRTRQWWGVLCDYPHLVKMICWIGTCFLSRAKRNERSKLYNRSAGIFYVLHIIFPLSSNNSLSVSERGTMVLGLVSRIFPQIV